VAEWFRRQPAELLYMGSIPIPGSTMRFFYESGNVDHILCNCIHVLHIYKNWILNSQLFLYSQIYSTLFGSLQMNGKKSFNILLKQQGYSEKAVEELWKWYDYSERKGVASY
jgi:hypothetical protein